MTRAAVLGAPVAHSLSPVLHRAAYDVLGLDWTYDAVEVRADDLAGFLAGLGEDWAGLSLTMPLKEVVLPLVDAMTPLASTVGSVNTVLLGPTGRTGFTTDVPGIAAVVTRLGISSRRPVASATILGGGATAASAVAGLAGLCQGPVTAYVRRPEAGRRLVELGEAVEVEVRTAPWSDAASGLAAELVLATTPAGATDQLAPLVPERAGWLLDVVYDPWPTALASSWAQAGGTVATGLDLLIEQAALQVQLMTGQPAPIAAMRAAGERALAARTGEPAVPAPPPVDGSPPRRRLRPSLPE